MAEAIGVASAIVGLVVFAAQSSIALCGLIDSIQNAPRAMRDLKAELESLERVLLSLRASLDADPHAAGISALELPLGRCAEVCNDFRIMVEKLTARSREGGSMSMRDWAKLKYRGDDIAAFKDSLATYRATISIAIGHATLSTTRVTAKALADYEHMISETRSDLNEQLDKVNERLDKLAMAGPSMSPVSQEEQASLQREKQSAEKCLAICADMSTQISRLRPDTSGDQGSVGTRNTVALSDAGVAVTAASMTFQMFQRFEEQILAATLNLQAQINLINRRLNHQAVALSSPLGTGSGTDTTQQHQYSMLADREAMQRCLGICDDASHQSGQTRVNNYEDIKSSNDGQQIIVSTVGDLINARRVTAGANTAQWMGQMSDTSLQQLTQTWPKRPGQGHREEDRAQQPSESGSS